MKALNYNHLQYFWAVANEGNLTRAAAHMNVSQSALSIQIRKLEDQLGHPLFERRGRQLVLTEAGRITLDHANAIFAAGSELVDTLRERVGREVTVLRVGAVSTLSRNFQIGFLEPLLGRPDVHIVMHSGRLGDLLVGLESHRHDIVLANESPDRDSASPWIAHLLAEQPVTLVGTPARLRSDLSLTDLLQGEPLVVPSVMTSIRSGFDALIDRLGVRPRIIAEVDDMAMLRLLARADIGLAVVPPIVVRDELAQGALIAEERFPELKESFYAITPRRRFPNPLLKTLLEDHQPDPLMATLARARGPD